MSSCKTAVVAVDVGCDLGDSMVQEVWWHAGANNWPHKPTQWAEGRFQEICYRTGEPLVICRLQLHQELNGDVAA